MRWLLPIFFLMSFNSIAEIRLVVPKESYLSNYNLRDGELFTTEDSKVLYIHVDGEATQISNPAGVILAFGGTIAPAGYLICNGSAISRTTYASLFAAIGTAFGYGDGSTTFNLPDLRGRFLRGVDGSAGRDPDKNSRTTMNTGGNVGNNVGSVQADANLAHTHTSPGASGSNGTTGPYTIGSTVNNASITTSSSGSSEARPKNAYVNYIIKI